MSATVTNLADEITQLQAAVAAEQTVEQSAVTLLNAIPGLIANAVAQAQAAGASPEQLQALTDLTNAVQAHASDLAAAVAANTPVPPPAPAPAEPLPEPTPEAPTPAPEQPAP